MAVVEEQTRAVLNRVAQAAHRAGRDPAEIVVVAVGKGMPVSRLAGAIRAGIVDLGENYLQEARPKIQALRSADRPLRWHFTGHLQKNKAAAAVEMFDIIHTVDSLELLERLSRLLSKAGRTMPVLLEVNLGEEATKSGIHQNEVSTLVAAARDLPGVDACGLMTIPPAPDRPEDSRPYFRRLRELARTHGLPHLSMGMSEDFEIAIEEGATFVRVGTAIFGPR